MSTTGRSGTDLLAVDFSLGIADGSPLPDALILSEKPSSRHKEHAKRREGQNPPGADNNNECLCGFALAPWKYDLCG